MIRHSQFFDGIVSRLAALLAGLAMTGSALAAITNPTPQRAYVSVAGSDSNNCGATAPCRTIQAALGQVMVGGEVLVVDSGGFGSQANGALLTITQSVTIVTAPGVYAGLSPPAGVNGIVINAPGASVTLRGLTIHAQSEGQQIPGNGISILSAAGVHIDGCTVQNMLGAGITTIGHTAPLFLSVERTTLVDNATGLELVTSLSGALGVTAVLHDLVITAGGALTATRTIGIDFQSGTEAVLTDSAITGNAIGIFGATGPASAHMIVRSSTIDSTDAGVLLQIAPLGLDLRADLSHCVITGASMVNGTTIVFGAGVAVLGIAPILATAAPAVSLDASQIIGNWIGVWLYPNGNGTVSSYGNNVMANNGTDVVGVLAPASGK